MFFSIFSADLALLEEINTLKVTSDNGEKISYQGELFSLKGESMTWCFAAKYPNDLIIEKKQFALDKTIKVATSLSTDYVCSVTIREQVFYLTSKAAFAKFRSTIQQHSPHIKFTTDLVNASETWGSCENIDCLFSGEKLETLSLSSKYATFYKTPKGTFLKYTLRNPHTINEALLLQSFNGQCPYLGEVIKITADPLNILFEMPFYSGGSIFQHISETRKRSDSIPESLIRKWISQIAIALQFLHNQGVAHRDVKTENIVLDEKENTRLIDLGLASQLGSMKQMKDAVGTCAIVAPEVLMVPTPYDQRCDIYSLGCVLYTLIYQHAPFSNQKESMDQERRKFAQKQKSEPDESFPYSRELFTLYQQMMNYSPNYRPSLEEIIEVLNN